MTPAAVALPDAAVRMVRAVAGRRALQVVLLLAGLLALGFLCGERAHAVDGVPAPKRVESARAAGAEGSAQPVRERVAEPVRDGREAVRDGREAVREAAVEPAADAVEPVARTARGVVEPVVDGVTGVVEGAPQRVLPDAPDLPGTPGVPSVPGIPGTPDLPQPGPVPGPGHGAGDGDEAGAGDEARAPHAGQGEATARTHEARAESSYGTGTGVGTGTGITCSAGQQACGSAPLGDGSSDDARRTGHGPVPFPSVPGDPGRTLGGQSAGDGSSTRHGDPCAASYGSRAPVRLLHGAGAAQVSATVRERHRDIPEFPG
ncbi:hypothetical protein AB0Q95_31765 [Streptomyces sp. NPDC059900]|uniref:hypothetical protein n=1 Tax=Streptomyces sp. NPDC059900 TaxID=3155816 RepID=UPI00341D98C4